MWLTSCGDWSSPLALWCCRCPLQPKTCFRLICVSLIVSTSRYFRMHSSQHWNLKFHLSFKSNCFRTRTTSQRSFNEMIQFSCSTTLETLTRYGANTFWHIFIDVQRDWLFICNKEVHDSIVEWHKSYKVEFKQFIPPQEAIQYNSCQFLGILSVIIWQIYHKIQKVGLYISCGCILTQNFAFIRWPMTNNDHPLYFIPKGPLNELIKLHMIPGQPPIN